MHVDSIHARYLTRKYLAYVQLCIDLKSPVMLNCAMIYYLWYMHFWRTLKTMYSGYVIKIWVLSLFFFLCSWVLYHSTSMSVCPFITSWRQNMMPCCLRKQQKTASPSRSHCPMKSSRWGILEDHTLPGCLWHQVSDYKLYRQAFLTLMLSTLAWTNDIVSNDTCERLVNFIFFKYL